MPQTTQQINQLNEKQVASAVENALQCLYDKKTKQKKEQPLKTQASNDDERIAKPTQELEKFSPTDWLHRAATHMAAQLKFGTHISKGVHPSSKGDNISFQPQHELPAYYVGTHSINSPHIDANGSAAALPLAAFFDYEVADGIKIRDLILADNADFTDSLSEDPTQAQEYQRTFQQTLTYRVDTPCSDVRNKQMLWVSNPYTADTVEALDYTNIIPLYPSVLTHEVFQRIKHIRYSEANKAARDNRHKKTSAQQPYTSMPNLAVVHLGGAKPLNVSQLTVKQEGCNYLLPSLPPIMDKSHGFKLSRFAHNIFDSNSLLYHCQHDLEEVYAVIKDARNNVDVRNRRKRAIDRILHTIFTIAQHYRTTFPAGWSKDYHINSHQKLWLDPKRAELADEKDFALRRTSTDWHKEVFNDFAQWFNTLLEDQFKNKKHDFGLAEIIAWRREIEDMSKRYERAGKGVFL